jgi:UPF0716 protein FxsA
MVFLLIVAALIAVPLIEIYVGSLVVDQIGIGPALLIVLAAMVLGVVVIRTSWRRRPAGADNGLLFVAGLLLLFPGYVTDVLGLLLLLPPVRAVLRVWIGQRVDRALQSWNLTIVRWDDRTGRLRRTDRTDYDSGDVVQGEVVDDSRPDDDDPPALGR